MTPPPTYRQTFALQSQLIAADASDYEYRVALLRLAEKLEQEKAEALAALEDCLPDWHSEDDGTFADGRIAGEISYADMRRIKAALTKAGYTF